MNHLNLISQIGTYNLIGELYSCPVVYHLLLLDRPKTPELFGSSGRGVWSIAVQSITDPRLIEVRGELAWV